MMENQGRKKNPKYTNCGDEHVVSFKYHPERQQHVESKKLYSSQETAQRPLTVHRQKLSYAISSVIESMTKPTNLSGLRNRCGVYRLRVRYAFGLKVACHQMLPQVPSGCLEWMWWSCVLSTSKETGEISARGDIQQGCLVIWQLSQVPKELFSGEGSRFEESINLVKTLSVVHFKGLTIAIWKSYREPGNIHHQPFEDYNIICRKRQGK